MNTVRSSLLFAAICSVGVTSIAQAQDFCGQVLAGGIWNVESGTTEVSRLKSFTNWFCSQEFSDEGSFKKSAAAVKAPINGVPVEFKGQKASSNWKSYHAAACAFRDEFTSEYSKDEYYSKIASKDVLDAWRECVSHGASLSTKYTAAKDTIVFEMRFVSDSVGAAPALKVQELSVFQTKEGKVVPASCTVMGAPSVRFDAATGKTTAFEVPDKASINFLCARDPCLVTHVGATADRTLRPNSYFEIPASRCDGDRLIENCVRQNREGQCLRCEFDVKVSGLGKGGSVIRQCAKMPPGQKYDVQIDMTVAHAAGPGPLCWDTPVMFGVDEDEKTTVVFDQANNALCKYKTQKATGFRSPKIDTIGKAQIYFHRCSRGGDVSDCGLEGKIIINTPDGT